MGNMIWNNKKIMEFNDNYRKSLVNYFKTKEIKYCLDGKNIIIFPALFDKRLIFKVLTQNEKYNKLIKSIKNELIKEGAIVIFDEEHIDHGSLKYFDAQIEIVFSHDEKDDDLTVYMPFKSNDDCTSITRKLIKKVATLEKSISYKIANIWSKIGKKRYWKFLFKSSTTTLVLELSNSILTNEFIDIFTNTIIEEFGYKPSEDDLDLLIFQLKELNINSKNNTLSINNNSFKKSNDKLKNTVVTNNKKKNEIKKANINNKNNKFKGKTLTNSLNSGKNIGYFNPKAYPMKDLGEGPVYEFKRPKRNTKNNK